MNTTAMSIEQLAVLMDALTQYTDNMEINEHPEPGAEWWERHVNNKRVALDMLATVEKAHHFRLMGGEH